MDGSRERRLKKHREEAGNIKKRGQKNTMQHYELLSRGNFISSLGLCWLRMVLLFSDMYCGGKQCNNNSQKVQVLIFHTKFQRLAVLNVLY